MGKSFESPARIEEQPLGVGPASDLGVRVLAVDDHPRFREALGDLVASVPGFVLVGQASSGEEALLAVERLSPHVVLMDVVMPGIGGIAAARVIVSEHPDVAVMLISIDDPALNPATTELGKTVAFARKQDLCPSRLRQVWEMHQREMHQR
jgi:chemotaxis response regulator CheB